MLTISVEIKLDFEQNKLNYSHRANASAQMCVMIAMKSTRTPRVDSDTPSAEPEMKDSKANTEKST